jgi:hypothetical protein
MSPVLNGAKKEWTAGKPVDCFEMDGLFCRIGQALAQGELCVKVGQQCTRASLISISACEPSAEQCKEAVDYLKTGGLLRNGWTPLPDRPGPCLRRVMSQIESGQCTRAGLIPIRGRKPSAELCKEGDVSK